ncbi:MAG: hypothetical protein R3B06_00930 [Kofleriaceae bacterium]
MNGLDDPADFTFELEADGRLVRRQLARRLWEHRGWATGLYHYQELDPATEAWRPARAALIRFRKVGGGWRKHAAINLPAAVAAAVGPTLTGWFPDADPADDDHPLD